MDFSSDWGEGLYGVRVCIHVFAASPSSGWNLPGRWSSRTVGTLGSPRIRGLRKASRFGIGLGLMPPGKFESAGQLSRRGPNCAVATYLLSGLKRQVACCCETPWLFSWVDWDKQTTN